MLIRFESSRLLFYSWVMLTSVPLSWGATATVSSGSGRPGYPTNLNLTLANAGSAAVSAIQWTLTYSAADISSITVTPGTAATAAGKSVSCSGTNPVTCLAFGINRNGIADGELASFTVNVNPASTSNSTVIGISKLVASDASGQPLATTGVSGSLSLSQGSSVGGSPSSSASFIKLDTTTSGTWKGAYGNDGYNVIGDSSQYPSYVSVTPSGHSPYTWTTSTGDTRALQKPASSTERIASAWYTFTSMSMELNFQDSAAHMVALYMLDWDGHGGGRYQRVEILDSGGNVLDSRIVYGFNQGQYLVWSLTGRVTIRVVNLNSASNAVVNGLFFSGQGGAVSFVGMDSTTSGSWKGVYGSEGYNVVGTSANLPSYVTMNSSGAFDYIWAQSTSDPRALQKPSPATDRIASTWVSSSSFTIGLNFLDTAQHQVAISMLDWDNHTGGRSQRIEILNSANQVLDSRSVSGFVNGQYLVYIIRGPVIIRVTNLNPSSNAVVNGVFFAPASSSGSGSVSGPASAPGTTATFLNTDTTTLGNWKGVYGSDGYNVIGDGVNYPSYASVNATGAILYKWTNSTTDARALQKPASADRVAATWYIPSSLTVEVNLTDGARHRVAIYLLDWDGYFGRSERIEILDPANGNAVLDSRTVSNFVGGQYLVWNISGRVLIRVTNLNPISNAVLNGIFF